MTNKSHQKPEISISTSSEDETQEKAKILGEYIRKGDLILFDWSIAHGISPIDPNTFNQIDWDNYKGRWSLMAAINKTVNNNRIFFIVNCFMINY